MTQSHDTTGKPPHVIEVKVAEIPKPYHDICDLLNAEGGDAMYEAMIANARPGPSWMIDHLDDVRGHDLTRLSGTVEACEDMLDTLIRQPPIARSVYVRELAEKLEVPERDIRQTLNAALLERENYYRQHPDERPKPAPVWERDAL